MIPVLLALLVGPARADGPLGPMPMQDGSDQLDGAEELPADSGAALVSLGARSPYTGVVDGEWFGGFAGIAGVARGIGLGLALPDSRRLPLDGSSHRLDPGPVVLTVRLAPFARIEGLAVDLATARPIGSGGDPVGRWELRGAYGRSWRGTRAFANLGMVLPEQGVPAGWAGVGLRQELGEHLACTADAWAATTTSARASGAVAWRPSRSIEVGVAAAPTLSPGEAVSLELLASLAVTIDPRELDLRGDRDADGVYDDVDPCPLTPGEDGRGCPGTDTAGACGCVFDVMPDAEIARLLDLLRQPVAGRVFVVQVWVDPGTDETLDWRNSVAESQAVLERLLRSGVSTFDLRVLAMGPATQPDDPRIQVQTMEPWLADQLAAEVGRIAPIQLESP